MLPLPAQHGVLAFVLAGYGWLAWAAPYWYESLAQEDSLVEWLTFGLFASAAVAYSVLGRRLSFPKSLGAFCLALFCLCVAGEEISWGQRMAGFTPPEIFLKGNYQQEANFHNLVQHLFKPKWLLFAILVGWGCVFPVLMRLAHRPLAFLSDRWGFIFPPLQLVPWSAAGAILIAVYPVTFTGEYMELLGATLFYLMALPEAPPRDFWILLPLPFILTGAGFGWTEAQARMGHPAKMECARAETAALAKAIQSGRARPRLLDKDSVHKRLFTAIVSKYVHSDVAKAMESVSCAVRPNPNRKAYCMDPWGQPYWIRYLRDEEDAIWVTVYSFGPNRRRDSTESGLEGTDDIGVRVNLPDAEGGDSEGGWEDEGGTS